MALEAKGLVANARGHSVITNVSLTVAPAQITALQGANGSGKTSLVRAIAGDPAFTITKGQLHLDGTDLIPLTADKRAEAGLFISFQHPVELPNISVIAFLKAVFLEKGRLTLEDFAENLEKY